jgi:hypothetical protein
MRAISFQQESPAAKGDKSKKERGEFLRLSLPGEATVFI